MLGLIEGKPDCTEQHCPWCINEEESHCCQCGTELDHTNGSQ
jgi:hypothetical protein